MAGQDGGLYYQASKRAPAPSYPSYPSGGGTASGYTAKDIAFFQILADREAASYAAAAAPPSRGAMDADPTYAAFMREVAAQRNNMGANRDRLRGYITQDQGLATADIDRRSPLEIKGLKGGFESRGMYRSGAMEKALADRAAYEAQRRNVIAVSAAQRLGDVEAEYAGRMLEMNQQIAAQRLQMTAAGYT